MRVGIIDGKYVANPTYTETRASKLNMIVAGSDQGIVMVEAGAQQVTEEEVLGALEHGLESCQKIIKVLKQLVAAAGKPKKEFTAKEVDAELLKSIDKKIRAELIDALNTKKYEKLESYARVDALHDKVVEEAAEEQKAEADTVFKLLKERVFRDEMLEARRRPDGRAFDEIRAIWGEVGVLPRTHGSAVFTRGETQALVTVNAGHQGRRTARRIAGSRANRSSASCCTTTSRRSASAKWASCADPAVAKSATALSPSAPYPPFCRMRRSSPTRCAWSATFWNRTARVRWLPSAAPALALMDAGVPISAPVGGVAMGLVKEGDKYAILTDIAGAEDHYGDMDFKVAGTKDGITALQMDIKVAERHHGADEGSARAGAPRAAVHSGQDESRFSPNPARICRRTRRAFTR